MDRKQLVLTAMAPADGASHSPVQIQKLLFLLDREMPEQCGGVFNFRPYNYGPFDKSIYAALEELQRDGYIEILGDRWDPWRSYRLTPEGQQTASELFSKLDDEPQEYISKASSFVKSQPFARLVAAIYKKYPDMKKNSVFQE